MNNQTLTGRSTARFYDPVQIFVATFLGTLLAGATCIALNFSKLEKRNSAIATWVVTGILVPAALAAFIVVPASKYDRLIPIVSALTLAGFAWFFQRRAIAQRFASGAKKRSNWNLLGLIVASLLTVLLAFVVLLALLS